MLRAVAVFLARLVAVLCMLLAVAVFLNWAVLVALGVEVGFSVGTAVSVGTATTTGTDASSFMNRLTTPIITTITKTIPPITIGC